MTSEKDKAKSMFVVTASALAITVHPSKDQVFSVEAAVDMAEKLADELDRRGHFDRLGLG